MATKPKVSSSVDSVDDKEKARLAERRTRVAEAKAKRAKESKEPFIKINGEKFILQMFDVPVGIDTDLMNLENGAAYIEAANWVIDTAIKPEDHRRYRAARNKVMSEMPKTEQAIFWTEILTHILEALTAFQSQES